MDASCANTYNEKRNAIYSPNYPGIYPKNNHCSWHVGAPIGSNIHVESFSYSMDESGDSLKIYDGSSNHSGRVANLYDKNEYSGMISTTNNLFFEFESDYDSVQLEGFQLILALIGMTMGSIKNLDQLLEYSFLKMKNN